MKMDNKIKWPCTLLIIAIAATCTWSADMFKQIGQIYQVNGKNTHVLTYNATRHETAIKQLQTEISMYNETARNAIGMLRNTTQLPLGISTYPNIGQLDHQRCNQICGFFTKKTIITLEQIQAPYDGRVKVIAAPAGKHHFGQIAEQRYTSQPIFAVELAKTLRRHNIRRIDKRRQGCGYTYLSNTTRDFMLVNCYSNISCTCQETSDDAKLNNAKQITSTITTMKKQLDDHLEYFSTWVGELLQSKTRINHELQHIPHLRPEEDRQRRGFLTTLQNGILNAFNIPSLGQMQEEDHKINKNTRRQQELIGQINRQSKELHKWSAMTLQNIQEEHRIAMQEQREIKHTYVIALNAKLMTLPQMMIEQINMLGRSIERHARKVQDFLQGRIFDSRSNINQQVIPYLSKIYKKKCLR